MIFNRIVAALITLCALNAICQTTGNQSSASASAQSNPALAVRDTDAIHTMELAIEAMGGVSSWNKIHTIEEKGTSQASTPHADPQTFRWLDAWSGRHVWFRRENSAASSPHPYTYSPGHPPMSRSKGNSVPLQTFSLPSPHIPAATLLTILSDKNCALVGGREASSGAGEEVQAVEVLCPAIPGAATPVRQHWEFSRKTNLPSSVRISTPSAVNGVQTASYIVWRYSHFQVINNVLLPDDLTVQHGRLFTTNLHVESIEFPTKASINDYKGAQ